MTDFLDVKRDEIEQRLSELRPLVEEYHRLESAAAALAGVGGNLGSATAPARRARRPRAAAPGAARTVTRRRRATGGTRATQALDLVRSAPGISIPELAAKMGIKQNYLYRVLPRLESDGQVEKRGRGWHPKG